MLWATGDFSGTPFFRSSQGDKRLDYGGYAPGFDRIIVQGDPDALDFIAFYVRHGRTSAACGVGHNAAFTSFLHLLNEGRVPSPEAIEAGVELTAIARGDAT